MKANGSPNNSNDRVLCYYLIGFFDVLGQSNDLRQLKQLPSTDAEKAAALEQLKKTAGFVMHLRGMFRDCLATID